MMEAARTSETSVDNFLHGSTTQKTILNFILAVRAWNLTKITLSTYDQIKFEEFLS
jgi:hypothetical protein